MITSLAGWENFYIIVGLSAAALTGLMFVVIALTAETRGASDSGGMAAFASPTILHFCAVLLVSAILTTPGHTNASLSFSLFVSGLAGMAYSTRIIVRMRRQRAFTPENSDWVWYILLPLVGYVCLLGSAAVVWVGAGAALYSVAAGALLLLYVGIHNAWDAAIWVAVHKQKGK
ncbi:MAG TPA: hypothetical protein VKB91_02990 [Gemmatimonadaceae bacterium]|nr:hypothetical protein [Gemmatimonadaceae bacterium]